MNNAERARQHRWQTAETEPKPRRRLTAQQIASLEAILKTAAEDRLKGKQRLHQATREARQ